MKALTLLALLVPNALASFDLINDCGGVPRTNPKKITVEEGQQNTKALVTCLQKAAEDTTGDRTVVVPENKVFSAFGFEMSNIKDITLQIDGTLELNPNYLSWPLYPG